MLADTAPREPILPVQDPEAEAAAVSRRLALLEWGVEAERLQERLERGEGLPSVSLGGTVLRHDFSGMEGQNEALVFAMVSLPITDGWATDQRVDARIARCSSWRPIATKLLTRLCV